MIFFIVKTIIIKMFECEYCDLFFEEKRLLVTHQKTKKCSVHRSIGFMCQKCFKSFKGYDTILNHVTECKVEIGSNEGLMMAVVNQLSDKFKTTITFNEDKTSGQITFSKEYNYTHPKNLVHGLNLPQKIYLFVKNKKPDSKIIGSHGHYINDIYNSIIRLSEPFQFLCLKYNFAMVVDLLWLKVPTTQFYIKNDDIYVLGKVQCENEDKNKWYGDTFLLNENEKIVKCVWYKDPQLQQFFSNLYPILTDVLNLYLTLGYRSLKKDKIKLKTDLKTDTSSDQIIQDLMDKYNLTNVVNSIKILNSYETFYNIFKTNLYKKFEMDVLLHTNIDHVFKDELLPSNFFLEEFSLMNNRKPEYIGGNYDYLLHYILPDSEKKIFISKE
jgi:hypothetical protein